MYSQELALKIENKLWVACGFGSFCGTTDFSFCDKAAHASGSECVFMKELPLFGACSAGLAIPESFIKLVVTMDFSFYLFNF